MARARTRSARGSGVSGVAPIPPRRRRPFVPWGPSPGIRGLAPRRWHHARSEEQASLLVGRNPLSRLPSGRGRRGGLRPPSIPRAGALMGRPPRAPQGASTAKVTVRLPEQVAAGLAGCGCSRRGLTVSDWVRGQVAAARPGEPAGLVGRRPPRRRTGLGRAVAPPVDPAVVVQLARIGNNLNQIARHLNATGGPLTVAGLVTLQTIAAATSTPRWLAVLPGATGAARAGRQAGTPGRAEGCTSSSCATAPARRRRPRPTCSASGTTRA